MLPTTTPTLESVYFLARLGETRRAAGLPAEMQFDLARSDLTDDELEQVMKEFGAPTRDSGWGLSAVMEDLLTKSPNSIPVSDLQKLQGNLISQGYAPPDASPNGVWDPSWYGYFRRWDRDNYEAQQAGHHFLAAPLAAGFELIANTLPSRVYQGLIGAAKGFALQAPETAERVGAVGGAVAGAGIGAAVGSVIPGAGTVGGAIIGGAIGGVVGFAADFFGSDPGEEDQSGFEKVVDALSPAEEYAQQGPRAFFEDVGWVATAASLISGVGAAVKGATGGVAAIRGIQAASTKVTTINPLSATLAAANPVAASPVAVTTAAKGLGFAKAAMLRPPAAQLGLFGKLATWSTSRGASQTPAWLSTWMQRASPFAFAQRPGMMAVQEVVTGLTTASIGARYAGGYGQGEHTSTIEKSIAEAPLLESGVKIPLVGDLVDVASFVLWPTRFFPFKVRSIGRAATSLMGETSLKPFIDADLAYSTRTTRASRSRVKEVLTPQLNSYVRMDFGIHYESALAIAKAKLNPVKEAAMDSYQSSIIDIRHKILNGDKELLAKVMGHSVEFDGQFTKWLIDDAMSGRGIEGLQDYADVLKYNSQIERTVASQQPLELAGLEGMMKPSVARGVWSTKGAAPKLDRISLKAEAARLEASARRLDTYSARRERDPWVAGAGAERSRLMRAQADHLRRVAADLPTGTRVREGIQNFHITPANLDTPTRKTYFELRDQYLALREKVKASWAEGRPTATNAMDRQELYNFVDELALNQYIPEELAAKAKAAEPAGIDKRIAKILERRAQGAAQDIELPEGVMKGYTDRGFKPVHTGEDTLFPAQMDELWESAGIGDYTRRASFWESTGFSFRNRNDQEVFAFRTAHENVEVGQVMAEEGIKLNGKQVMRRLHETLAEDNHGSVVGPFVTKAGQKPHLYRIDIRELSPEVIRGTFSDVPGFTDEVASKVYAALKRGASYGGELKLLHPIDSARSIGRALRVNGLPGFSDVVRTWHTKDPFHLERSAYKSNDWVYRPKAEVARSPHRARVEYELKNVSRSAGITESQRQFGMAMLDNLAEVAVRQQPNIYSSVDDFYRRLDAGFADKYVAGASDVLFKRVREAPSMERLKQIATRQEGIKNADWYDRSAESLMEIFGYSKSTLRDGRVIEDYELMTNLLAVTSWQKTPAENLALALDSFEQFKRTGDIPFDTFKGTNHMWSVLQEVIDGHTISRWTVDGGPAKIVRSLDDAGKKNWTVEGTGVSFRTKVEAQAAVREAAQTSSGPVYEAFGARLKTINFNQNLLLASERVTVDRRIKTIFGESGSISAERYGEIEKTIQNLATELGMKPMQAQAALWASFKSFLQEEIPLLQRAGNHELAESYKFMLRSSQSNDSFMSFLKTPENEALLAKMREDGVLGGPYLEQRVRSEVLGTTEFGPDYQTVMRFFSGADFKTLIHEDAHLLRRLLPAEARVKLERGYGARAAEVVPDFTPVHPTHFDDHVDEVISDMHGRSLNPDDGFTYDPRTGKFIESGGKGYGVAVIDGTSVKSTLSEADFAARVRELRSKNGELFDNPRVFMGGWNDGAGNIHLDPSEVLMSKTEALRLGAQRDQESIFDFATGQSIDVPPEMRRRFQGGWSTDAEERFANDIERFISGRLEPRSGFSELKSALGGMWSKVRGRAEGENIVRPSVRRLMDDWFSDTLELIPKKHPKLRALKSKQVVGGAAIGAAEGAITDDEDRLGAALKGAFYGATIGLVGRKALSRTYGHLPDYLTRMNTSLRYTLSFTFDAGRYTEQNMIAMAKFGLPPMLKPKAHITSRAEGWKTPFANGTVHGQEAWNHVTRFWDELNGTRYFQSIDDIDRRMYQAGLLGFQPRNWEAAQAWQLYQRGMPTEKIREAITQIGRYGLGRSAAEKSANFIFFPFSFSKKMLITLGDFVLQAPGRNLLITEGMRRYHQSTLDEKFHDFIEDKAPLLDQLSRVNNLAFGLSPGRFFLDGLDDNRTNVGKVMQSLASVFIPSGAATPLAQAAGGLGDLSVHAFVPIVITGESINRAGGIDGLDDIIQRYIPFIRELGIYSESAGEQFTALTEGETPYSQFTDYNDELRAGKAELEDVAIALGYSSVDGLLDSDFGSQAFSPQIDQQRMDLANKYPSGFAMSTQFENSGLIDDKALQDLADKPNPSAAEEAILQLAYERENMKMLPDLIGIDSSLAGMIATKRIREIALKWVADQRFAELYERFFEREYGPITRVA